MEPALILLAVAGVLAIALRVLRSLFRVARSGTESWVAGETAQTRARRGDLTGMSEAGGRQEQARRRRRRAVLGLLGWIALLVVPMTTPWSREIYAVYSVLWLQSAGRSRGGALDRPRHRHPQ